jgi:hypothetical protein
MTSTDYQRLKSPQPLAHCWVDSVYATASFVMTSCTYVIAVSSRDQSRGGRSAFSLGGA